MRIDLHCHSTASDGSDAPAEVAARAAARGVELFALTDHDTCTEVAVAGARVHRAVEMSCDDPDTGRTIHVLAYDRGGAGWTELAERLGAVMTARRNRLRVMAARPAQRGSRLHVGPPLPPPTRPRVGRPDPPRLVGEAG